MKIMNALHFQRSCFRVGVTDLLSEEFTSEARPTGKEAALHSPGEGLYGPRTSEGRTPKNELDIFDAHFKVRSGWSIRERVSAES